jgi:hypothetical protein
MNGFQAIGQQKQDLFSCEDLAAKNARAWALTMQALSTSCRPYQKSRVIPDVQPIHPSYQLKGKLQIFLRLFQLEVGG